MTNDRILVQGTTAFETEGRLLQELGERLVSNSEVALVELIKNAYDADAPTCWIVSEGDTISVIDDGNGMTEADFLGKWMRIATGDKQRERFSTRFDRTMTGAKGIGRFAVRFLGRVLRLESVSDDPSYECRTRLEAVFDWEEIDRQSNLREARIEYSLRRAAENEPTGTTLEISRLRASAEIEFGKELRNQVLGIVSPTSGLDSGRFGKRKVTPGKEEDPGFALVLPSEGGTRAEDVNLAKAILSHYFSKVVIEHESGKVTYTITHRDGRVLLDETFPYQSHLSQGLHADIRFLPRRKAMFQGSEVNGHKAWKWIKKNCGVRVIDHGFAVTPYGSGDDDWLHLGLDKSHNRREWRGSLMAERFPISGESGSLTREKANPMLYLPGSSQLVGAVFVESTQGSDTSRPTDLIPAINREGYIENEGYKEVVDIVRTGLELLAMVDHREKRREEQERAESEASDIRSDFREAIEYIRNLPSLTEEDRDRLTIEYSAMARKLEDVEDYFNDASQRMDTMALLGVLAGFMTHESRRLVGRFSEVVEHLETLAGHDRVVAAALPEIRRNLDEFGRQLRYSTMFVEALQDKGSSPGAIPVLGQIELVKDTFSAFCNQRGIKVDVHVEEGLTGPAMHVPLYSGILLNLYTNALKAVTALAAPRDERRVSIRAWNDPKWHVIEVADRGIGIPPHLRKRIWDPLFTTTSGGSGNPLGSGMGLGLSLIKDLMGRLGGRIELVEPPGGYVTCFRAQFPWK